MHCPQCGTFIKGEDNVCPNCKKIVKRTIQKYCKKCGAKASQYANSCEECGSHDLERREVLERVNAPSERNSQGNKSISQNNSICSSSVSAIKLIAVIAMILFFIPCMTVKCSGQTVAELSDFNVLSGVTYEGDEIYTDETDEESATLRIFALLVAVFSGVAIFGDLACNSYKQRGIVSVISGIGISFSQVLLKDKVVEWCDENGARVVLQYPHYIIIIAGILICILGVVITAMDNSKDSR